MHIKIVRLGDNGNASVEAIYIDGILRCGSVADEEREVKLAGETRVPNGKAFLGLRREGGKHAQYLKKFGPEFHKGMICAYNAEDWTLKLGGMSFQYVLIHPGNTERDTDACILPNFILDLENFKGQRSVAAYKAIYPEIVEAILKWERCRGCKQPTIEWLDIETGK